MCLNVREYECGCMQIATCGNGGKTSETMKASAEGESVLLTVSQVAHRLGVSQRFIRELIARRTLPSVKLGGARRVPVKSLDQYLTDLMVHAR